MTFPTGQSISMIRISIFSEVCSASFFVGPPSDRAVTAEDSACADFADLFLIDNPNLG
jgi:hypothetical protein